MAEFWDVAEEFYGLVTGGRLQEAIARAENELGALQTTPFHIVLGRDLLGQVSDAADWLSNGYDGIVAEGEKVVTLYLEMNGFDINPERWFVDGFYTDEWCGLNGSMDWLCSLCDFAQDYTVRGFEDLQEVYAAWMQDQPEGQYEAHEWTGILVQLRIQELFAAAHERCRQLGRAVGSIPMLTTVHDSDMVHPTGPIPDQIIRSERH